MCRYIILSKLQMHPVAMFLENIGHYAALEETKFESRVAGVF